MKDSSKSVILMIASSSFGHVGPAMTQTSRRLVQSSILSDQSLCSSVRPDVSPRPSVRQLIHSEQGCRLIFIFTGHSVEKYCLVWIQAKYFIFISGTWHAQCKFNHYASTCISMPCILWYTCAPVLWSKKWGFQGILTLNLVQLYTVLFINREKCFGLFFLFMAYMYI